MEGAKTLRVAAVPMVGIRSVPENCAYIIDKIAVAARHKADIVVFPETGTDSYQPKQVRANRAAIEAWLPRIAEAVGRAAGPTRGPRSGGPWVVLGTWTFEGEKHANSDELVIKVTE